MQPVEPHRLSWWSEAQQRALLKVLDDHEAKTGKKGLGRRRRDLRAAKLRDTP